VVEGHAVVVDCPGVGVFLDDVDGLDRADLPVRDRGLVLVDVVLAVRVDDLAVLVDDDLQRGVRQPVLVDPERGAAVADAVLLHRGVGGPPVAAVAPGLVGFGGVHAEKLGVLVLGVGLLVGRAAVLHRRGSLRCGADATGERERGHHDRCSQPSHGQPKDSRLHRVSCPVEVLAGGRDRERVPLACRTQCAQDLAPA
jgi:hypothetical protein